MKHLTLLAAVFVLFQFIDQAYATSCPCFTWGQLARTTQIVSPEEITTCADVELEVGPGEKLITDVIRVTKEGSFDDRILLGLFTTQLVTEKAYHYHCIYNPVLFDPDDPATATSGVFKTDIISLREIKACRWLFRHYYKRVQKIECPGF